MANALVGQLDYIYFFYGLVLFLLGAVCISMTRAGPLQAPWWLLGGFGFAHGVAEWLHLLALTSGDSAWFAHGRTLCIGVSFLLLLEFARRAHRVLLGRRVTAWIFLAPGAGLLGFLLAEGPAALLPAVRLLLALPAALWTAVLFLVAARRTESLGGGAATKRARRWSALCFAAFGLAAGVVVPAAPFLPAGWPTSEAVLAWTGVPIQLVRALLVSGMALSIWALAVSFDPKGRVLRKRRVLFWVMASTIGVLLASGWLFTEWLGRLHDETTVADAEMTAAQVHDHLMDQMEDADGGVRALSQLVTRLRVGVGPDDRPRLDDLVDSIALATDDWVVYVLDPGGTSVASSNRARPDSFLGKNYATRPYYQQAREGRTGQFIGMGIVSGVAGYFSSEPVRDEAGAVVAIAVVKLNLTPTKLGPEAIDDSFIVGTDGRVLVSSRPWPAGRPLWSAGAAAPGTSPALLDHPVTGTDWFTRAGRRQIAVTHAIPPTDWSLVVVKAERTQVANRLLGIVITLLLCAVILSYFVAMQRQLGAESYLTDRHREAEGRAREFARQADTDALTGVLNRLGFNGAFARELERCRRYRNPLAVVLIDLDHFKRVNDTHGHVAGDRVLVGAARLIEANVRESDLVARWGGEEFVVVAPMTTSVGAAQLAEKIRSLLAATPLGEAGLVTGSFGVAELQPGDGVEALLHRADEALYRAKEGGRNRVEVDGLAGPVELELGSAAAARAYRPPPGTPRYADTGFDPIDQDHRALSLALDDLIEKVNAGEPLQVQAALEGVLAGVADHFGREEQLMRDFGYPLLRRHEEAHALFVEDARTFLGELKANGVTLSFRRWAVGRLLEWFRFHILAHDVALGHFLLKAGARAWQVHAVAG